MRKGIYRLLLLLSLMGVLFSGYKIVSGLLAYREGEQTYQDIQDLVQIPTTQETQSGEQATETWATKPEKPVYIDVDFDALRQINGDVVAWIYIPGTDINYPVMQGTDNEYYLHTMMDGTYNIAGSIFMDCYNEPDFSDPNTILYGHHMANGTMFAGITKYRNQAYYDEHPTGILATPEKQMLFHVVAAYVATVEDTAWQLNFEDDADALRWIQAAMKRTAFDSAYEPQLGDRIVTLSTCSYDMKNARFVVMGVLTEE